MEISDLRGIDISSWQAGLSAASLNSVDFAILKISEGTGWSDPQFANFYDMATIPLGAYVYSHATTEDEAIEEAEAALKLAKGKKLPLGIYIDVEEQKQLALRDSVLTAVVKAFCDTIKAGGYVAGAYGSAGQLWAKVGPHYVGDDVIVWVAQWGGRPHLGDLWQFSAADHVDGYLGNVDGDKVLSERFAALVAQNEFLPPEPTPAPVDDGTISIKLPVLKQGDSGFHVRIMQTALISKGYSCGWMGADGDFGANTKIALFKFHKSIGIDSSEVVCNADSWKALLEVN